MLYLNMNDLAAPAFESATSFFCKEVTPNAKTTFRALVMQSFVTDFRALQTEIAMNSVDHDKYDKRVEELWQKLVKAVGVAGEKSRPSDGASAAQTPSDKATAVATKPLSPDTSKRKA